MLKFKIVFLLTAMMLPMICPTASAQVGKPASPSPKQNNAIAAYVFGEENPAGAEALAEQVVTLLANSRTYSAPRRGAREFFREADRVQAGNRRQLLSDRDFCRIGSDFGVQFLAIIDIDRTGRGNSVWSRILDLGNCQVVATAEFLGFIRSGNEIRSAAETLSRDLLRRQIGRRSTFAAKPQPTPLRGNQIAAYVFGMEETRLGEDLSEAIVNGLVNSRTYSAPRRGAREFFREADRIQARQRGRLLDDRDFCRIGTDYEIEYLAIIDIASAGGPPTNRATSVWARIIDLETCRVIATGESFSAIRTQAQVRMVASEIVTELMRRRVGTRGVRR